MFKEARVLFIYTETPLHTGSGSSLSVVDLPIQRERHTNFPMVQASSLKGSLRDYAEQVSTDKKNIELVFGPEKEASEHAGAISFTDARLLLFPVRSLQGIFAWTTCPSILNRLKRDLAIVNEKPHFSVPTLREDDKALVTNSSKVSVKDKVVLEEFSYTAQKSAEANLIAEWISNNAFPKDDEYKPWKDSIRGNFVILPDNAFRYFTEYSTEIIARIKISNETKTVASNALWYEEHLPSDTLLYSIVLASDPLGKAINGLRSACDVLEFFRGLKINRFQLGGDITVGRGIVKLQIMEDKNGTREREPHTNT